MPCYYDAETKTWYCKFYYTDYTGSRKQKMKRGFKLQREAKEWEQEYLVKQSAQPSMTFHSLAELYLEDQKAHKKSSTYYSVRNIVINRIDPYFKNKPVNEITPADIRKWQADLKDARTTTGTPLSDGYMRECVVKMSCIMNYAVKFYGLASNPCKIAGNTIKKTVRRIDFWTQEEFNTFIRSFDTTSLYYMVFMTLYYTGIRIGELLALTASDVDLEENTITINKTIPHNGSDRTATPPKTMKSNRTISIPLFLTAAMSDHMKRFYAIQPDTRLFPITARSCSYQLDEHSRTCNIKRIRLHDLRHSHASLLIDMGFSPVLIAERLGHEDVSTTLNIYAHLYPSRQKEVADRLEALYVQNGSS